MWGEKFYYGENLLDSSFYFQRERLLFSKFFKGKSYYGKKVLYNICFENNDYYKMINNLYN